VEIFWVFLAVGYAAARATIDEKRTGIA